MTIPFEIQSNDEALLKKAKHIADEFVQPLMTDDIVSIVFLGGIARGYFDESADIDIAVFKKKDREFPIKEKFLYVEGIEVQIWLSDYEDELDANWDMSRRWTYTVCEIVHDTEDKISRLIAEKVPLQAHERKWLMMSGFTLSEWYFNRLTDLWVQRGNLISAQHMFNQGITYFFDMLFGLNNELVADEKWRYYCVEKLPILPVNFPARLQEVMKLQDFTIEELTRRKTAFLALWEEMRPMVEKECGMTFEEMLEVV
jgi:predicted nucleotidyltransferase